MYRAKKAALKSSKPKLKVKIKAEGSSALHLLKKLGMSNAPD